MGIADLYDLTGRTALVTGASRGIGEACARALDDAGARVVLAARSREDMEKVASELTNEAIVLEANLAERGAGRALADAAVGAAGRIDVLVNNAGVATYSPSRHLADDEVDRVLDVNLRSAMVLSGALAAHMADAGGGSIVHMSSVSGLAGVAHQHVYSASKAGLDAVTRSMAAEFGPKGVRVNSVAPGVIMTDMWAGGARIPGVIDKVVANTALRRTGTAEEVADVVVFLASDAARFVTGQVLAVDGGVHGMVPEILPRLE